MSRTWTAVALAPLIVVAASSARADDVNIPFTKTSLPNGMVVILSPDRTVPQVAVNVSYDVGSHVERPGRTGFAHLFEHLMFMGTRRAPTKMFDAWMEAAGGRNNAWTAEDRTDYFDIAPKTALPLLLWLEADRLRDLGQLIDQDKLDLQREVVRNERRQSIENRPYGVEELELPKLLWPDGHPYHHPVIGSHEDLEAASVADVKKFFETWYDPANASIVVAGDFDPQATQAMIASYFASIPTRGKPSGAEGPTPAVGPGPTPAVVPGPTPAAGPQPTEPAGASATPSDSTAPPSSPPALVAAPAVADPGPVKGVVRSTVPDNVELAKITLAWRSPRHFKPGDAEMDLLASVLAQGKASRLYKALVYDQKIAQDVSAQQESRVLGSDFVIEATVRPKVDPAKVEKALFDEIAKVRTQEISAEELERARNGYEMEFVDRLQRIPERASLLNLYEAEVGDPGFAGKDLERYRRATSKDLLSYAKKVLVPDGVVVLTIVPRKEDKP